MIRFEQLEPRAEEHPKGCVSKHELKAVSPFETARAAPPQGEASGAKMIRFLKDAPFKGSHGVYFVIKLAVLALAALLALHFLFGVV